MFLEILGEGNTWEEAFKRAGELPAEEASRAEATDIARTRPL
jgi:hypothetical protein